MPEPIRKLVIAGGGTAGWMTAAWFARLLHGAPVEIVLVESDEIGIVGVGEATTPYMHLFDRALGIDENDFLKFTGGTFKLGIEFVDWGRIGNAYHHSFGMPGRDYGPMPFHSVWMRNALSDPADTLAAYNLQTQAALHGKFMRPNGANSPLADITYALHFDAALYAKYLRGLAEDAGVRRIEGRIEQVRLTADGSIEGLSLTEGRSIDGDLFIDCTGFRSLLLGEALGIGFEDWSHWLPCDRAWAVPTAREGAPLPFTRSTARSAGWQWRIPLQHRDGNGLVFASAFMDEAEAVDQLVANLEGPPLADPRLIRFQTGRRKKVWEKNCVAIGLAAGFLEPLESTAIMLIQKAITYLQYLFPDQGFSAADRDLYNADMSREYEIVRDFLILHYRANERSDSEFWRYCSSMPIPDSLENRIDLFRSRGRILEVPGEQFRVPSWLAVMWGQGLRPAAPDPLAMTLNETEVTNWLAGMRDVIARCRDHMPDHADFIARHCAAQTAH
ncbi:MAG: tryptophan 7-halogenase [Asticcacaulis sp.]|uniref:tryptophan halogenase family protein n=1 Tax=Asticcacaulis sp. TaxID=1872648 RepID=UPI0039E2DE09